VALIAILLATSCSGSPPAPPAAATGPARGGTLTASLRSEPGTFNRLGPAPANLAPVDVLTRLTHATLTRVNRATGDVEPWLAERWTTSADGRTITLTLRNGVKFSDGAPFTSADVLFSFSALYDPAVQSVIASAVKVNGKPLQVTAPDPRTVVITMPTPFAPGVALLDTVPIYPKHQLQSALDSKAFAAAWGLTTPAGSMAGLGPFVLAEYAAGQRMTLARNPHYWRTDASGVALPYLDRLVVEFVKAQDPEMLRLQAGSIDVMANADVRPEDIAALRRLRDQGAVQLIDVGVGVDPDVLWFNLSSRRAAQKTKPYLLRTEFRQAISYAVDRTAIVNTVYLGAAVPVHGPVTPGNATWYSPGAPTYPHDLARAKTLLTGLGLSDRNGDGMLDDAAGAPVRFSIITQGTHIRERTAVVVQEQLRKAGIAVDIVGLDPRSIFARYGTGDYESIYYGFQASSLDPALSLDFWLSTGPNHVWTGGQPSPVTQWEKAVDDLVQRMAAAPSLAERQKLFAEVQTSFGEHLPGIYFVAPKVTVALGRRVGGATPVLLSPQILWSADTLYVR
jgi:peptide/nickel transport system substrate-binding protein